MVRINQKRVKQEVDGDVCSTHGKTRKAEYLIDDGKGGMCCAAGDQCKGSKGTSAAKPERKRRGKDVDADSCKWCEQGECWSHGQIEKPEKKQRREKITDIDGDVCSKHKKMRKAEFLIDDGKGGMCCADGDECKGSAKKGAKKSQVIGKFAKKQRKGKKEVDGDVCSTHGKRRKAEFLVDDDKGGMCCAPGDECKGGKDAGECKWCESGECWTHGQIEKPEKKERRGKADIDGDVCSKHKKTRKAEFLVDDGKGGMCCAKGDQCKSSKDAPRGTGARKGSGKQSKGRRGTSNTPSPAQVMAAIKVMQKANMGGGKGKGSRKGGGGGMWVQVGNSSQGSRKGGKGKGQRRR